MGLAQNSTKTDPANMAINPTLAAALLVLPCLLSLPATAASPDAVVVSELSALQSQSPTGVIHLTDALLRRVLSVPAPRPFHSVVFFDARKLHSKPGLALSAFKSQFALVSSAFMSNNPSQKNLIFFFEVEFDESKASFALFGVNSVPHICFFAHAAVDPQSESVPMDASDFSRLAESMADFFASKTNLTVGPIRPPPAISNTQILLTIAAALIWTPFLAKRLISGDAILHRRSTWMAGAIFVYFFSVSGTMFNVIRKMPLFVVDRKDPGRRPVFFHQGSGVQLGGEGFAVGFLYTVVGLLVAFVSHGLIWVRNAAVQRLLMMLAVFVSTWAVMEVIALDRWKTGYSVH